MQNNEVESKKIIKIFDEEPSNVNLSLKNLTKNHLTDKALDMVKVITIDGPAASGKTSVSRELAKKLGYGWVSTGAFYRGLGYAALKLDIDIQDELALANLAHSNIWSVDMQDEKTHVFFQGVDVTTEIAHEDVGSIASRVSHFPKVRQALLEGQRNCVQRAEKNHKNGLVAEGRDCGTVVFPDADLKVYLTADQENRAARRAMELGLSKEDMVAAQAVRDQQDSNRKAAPLAVAPDALVVDATHISINEVVDAILEKFKI